MPKLSLYYEAKPWKLNQKWGVHDPKTYAQFGFEDHNGIDINPGGGKEIRAPFPYEAFRTLWQPSGGGLVLSILSLEEYEAPDGKPAFVLIDYLHLERYVKVPGGNTYKGDMGDLLAIADNTGFSTGPHTHAQYRWVRKVPKAQNGLLDVEKNTANNSFNPEPYRNGLYAADYAILTLKVSLLTKVLSLLKLQKGIT